MPTIAVRQLCRRLAIVCLVVLVLYVGFAAIASIFPAVDQVEGARFWPAFLPDWPVSLLVILAAVFIVCDALLWAVSTSARGRERERLQTLAADWSLRADAKMAAAKGDPGLRLTSFRAESLYGAARLAWSMPATTFDRILVLRSTESFALSPHMAGHQAVAYEGDDTGFLDEGLAPNCVYFYTGFAEARGAGEWSPPAWAATTTKPRRLRDISLRSIWTIRP
jgi:hypothetical protein